MTSNEHPEQDTTSAVVVYESMYGNTRQVAEAIAEGLCRSMPARAVRVDAARAVDLSRVGLLVAGGPTHVWGMSRANTRRAAVTQAAHPKHGMPLDVEPGAEGDGLREWLATIGTVDLDFAAFDTRMVAPLGLSGSAARRIHRALRRHGAKAVGRPHGFLVSRENRLQPGELARAITWGQQLAGATRSVDAHRSHQA